MNPAGALALKLVLTPVLVGAASLAGRRWGSAIGVFPLSGSVLALLLPTGIALAFGCAIAVVLLVQGASLVAERRLGLA